MSSSSRPSQLMCRALLLASVALSPGFLSLTFAASSSTLPPSTWDGLVLTPSKTLDALYRKPGASLTGYRRIMLDPVEVAFRKNWTSDPRSVSSADRERIRRELAEEMRTVFRAELEKKGGYEFADQPAPDVLRVTAGLANIYIAAPDTSSAASKRVYVVSAGEMTLVAELRDAESGEVLALAIDRRRARETGMMQWATKASNSAEARAALRVWADLLRKALDASRKS
jgi:hypothetical protein